MKRLAARDFEDLLQVCGGALEERLLSSNVFYPLSHPQCAIPVFDGLLEGQHNRQLTKLLYRTAEWHALAKLRIHTDSSLTLLEDLTAEFGQLLRKFRDITCSTFPTFELPRETAARNRRKNHTTSKHTGNETNALPSANTLSQCTGPATSSGVAASSSLATQTLNDPLPAQAEILPAGAGKYAFKSGLYFSIYDAL